MSDSASDTGPLGRLRRPEYTGENRCIPCTVVNVGIAAVLSIGVWAAGARVGGAVPGAALGAGLFAASLAAIALRGYLLPYTPALTERYLPARVLTAFGKGPATRDDPHGRPTESGSDATDEAAEDYEFETLRKHAEHRANAVDIDRFLSDNDVVLAPAEEADDGWTVTDGFAAALRTAVGAVGPERPHRETMATLLDTEADDIEFRGTDSDYPEIKSGIRVRTWPSRAALLGDVAAERALSGWIDRWTAVPLEQRVEMRRLLRTGMRICPACGGEVVESEGTVESCCQSVPVVALVCTDCGDHLREYDPEGRPTRLQR